MRQEERLDLQDRRRTAGDVQVAQECQMQDSVLDQMPDEHGSSRSGSRSSPQGAPIRESTAEGDTSIICTKGRHRQAQRTRPAAPAPRSAARPCRRAAPPDPSARLRFRSAPRVRRQPWPPNEFPVAPSRSPARRCPRPKGRGASWRRWSG
ncbi:hypothetical protein GCM10010275_70000 [Streptomyces litmocidini]|nr:hypothetical protein GCM10010275_70000 [Streptomyces litmocidini]